MSDEQLRELERRWKQSGNVADEAAWLQARVRAGELDPERLKLAAWLGSVAARSLEPEALPGEDAFLLLPAVEERTEGRKLGDELLGVDAFAHDRARALRRLLKKVPRGPFRNNLRKEVEARAELATLRCFNDHLGHGLEEEITPLLESSELYWIERTVPNRRAAIELFADFDPDRRGSIEVTGDIYCAPDCCWGYHVAVATCALVLAKTLGLARPDRLGYSAMWPLVFWTKFEAEVCRALADDLRGWALGYDDPLRDRVEERWTRG